MHGRIMFDSRIFQAHGAGVAVVDLQQQAVPSYYQTCASLQLAVLLINKAQVMYNSMLTLQ